MKLLANIGLWLAATLFRVLILLFSPVALFVLVVQFEGDKAALWFKRMAISLDQHANVVLGPILNVWWVRVEEEEYKGYGLRYGDPDDTISVVTGRLQLYKGLTPAGKRARRFINGLFFKQLSHCVESLKEEEFQIFNEI